MLQIVRASKTIYPKIPIHFSKNTGPKFLHIKWWQNKGSAVPFRLFNLILWFLSQRYNTCFAPSFTELIPLRSLLLVYHFHLLLIKMDFTFLYTLSSGSSGWVGEGSRNMKSMRPPSVAIFFTDCVLRRKMEKGYVFTGMCHSVHREGVCDQGVWPWGVWQGLCVTRGGVCVPEGCDQGCVGTPPGQSNTLPPVKEDYPVETEDHSPPPPPQSDTPHLAATPAPGHAKIWSIGSQYASYWNAFLLWLIFTGLGGGTWPCWRVAPETAHWYAWGQIRPMLIDRTCHYPGNLPSRHLPHTLKWAHPKHAPQPPGNLNKRHTHAGTVTCIANALLVPVRQSPSPPGSATVGHKKCITSKTLT